MVWTDKDHVIGVVEESPDGLDLVRLRLLTRAKGIEADDDDGVGTADQCVVEPVLDTVVADAFNLAGRTTGQVFG